MFCKYQGFCYNRRYSKEHLLIYLIKSICKEIHCCLLHHCYAKHQLDKHYKTHWHQCLYWNISGYAAWEHQSVGRMPRDKIKENVQDMTKQDEKTWTMMKKQFGGQKWENIWRKAMKDGTDKIMRRRTTNNIMVIFDALNKFKVWLHFNNILVVERRSAIRHRLLPL